MNVIDQQGYVPRIVLWCADKDQVLKELWPTHTGREIAATMARLWPVYSWNKNVIIGRANRLGLVAKRPTLNPAVPRAERRAPSPPPPMSCDPLTLRLDLRAPEIPEPKIPTRPRHFPGEAVEPMIGTATIMGAGTSQCRYPMWADDETGAPDYPVCGRAKKTGSSYCEHHHSICWTRPARKRRAKPFVVGQRNSLVLQYGVLEED